jgi:hypothetical protein
LESVAKQEDLNGVELFLAHWGYNTEAVRDSIRNDPRIRLLSLQQFAGDFAGWYS